MQGNPNFGAKTISTAKLKKLKMIPIRKKHCDLCIKNQIFTKNEKKLLTNALLCARIYRHENKAELCKGSTADSDSVCLGSHTETSNPPRFASYPSVSSPKANILVIFSTVLDVPERKLQFYSGIV